MTPEREFQDTLKSILDQLVNARHQVEPHENGRDNDDRDAPNMVTLACVAEDVVTDAREIRKISTFNEVQLLTTDAGLVLQMNDGTEFQITIVRSR